MKKLFLIVLIVGSLISGAFALDLSLNITTEAKNKVAMISNASMDNITVYGQSYNALFYDDYTKIFSDLENVDTVSIQQDNGKNYLQVNKDGEYDGQCVSFVKGLSNYGFSYYIFKK